MTTDHSDLDFKTQCSNLFNLFPEQLSWSWDGGFNAALAAFGENQRDAINLSLEAYFSNSWDSDNILDAPDTTRNLSNQSGGLRAGQILFTCNPEPNTLLFCAWWPWGDGKTTSVRVSSLHSAASEDEQANQLGIFKAAFGLK